MIRSQVSGATLVFENGMEASLMVDQERGRQQFAFSDVSSETVYLLVLWDRVVEYMFGPYTAAEAANWLAKIGQMKEIKTRARDVFPMMQFSYTPPGPDAYWLGIIQSKPMIDLWCHNDKLICIKGPNLSDRIVEGTEEAAHLWAIFKVAHQRAERCGLR